MGAGLNGDDVPGRGRGGVRIAPSLLSADFRNLERAVRAAEEGGADLLHLDVMDGHFVPNLTFGPLVVEAVRRVTRLPLDVHLMVEPPEPLLEPFRRAGADLITVHVEAVRHLQRTLAEIRRLGARAGVALNPATPPEAVEYVWGDLDLILVMSVNPGFAGQGFLPQVLPKIRRLRAEAQRRGWDGWISVDGGIGPDTARLVADAGADTLVAGSAVFGQPDAAAAVRALRAAACA
jgi:ribulose-phosphate 3-epimerase